MKVLITATDIGFVLTINDRTKLRDATKLTGHTPREALEWLAALYTENLEHDIRVAARYAEGHKGEKYA